MGIRVQIPAYSDRWMMGDRFGEVVKTTQPKNYRSPIYHVRLDQSGVVRRYVADDCTMVEELNWNKVL